MKKVALYCGRLAVQLPNRIVIYELAENDTQDTDAGGMQVRLVTCHAYLMLMHHAHSPRHASHIVPPSQSRPHGLLHRHVTMIRPPLPASFIKGMP